MGTEGGWKDARKLHVLLSEALPNSTNMVLKVYTFYH